MVNKTFRILKDIASFILILVLIFFAMETLYRIYRSIKYKEFDFALKNKIEMKMLDSELGWKGNEYLGDIKAQNKKIMFIGDSFTHGLTIKKELLYYRVVKNYLNVEIFGYGGGGYGTLQEYLYLKRMMDLIKPDLVCLQVCSNDFINNSYSLEKKSVLNNSYAMRPYYINGQIKYSFPRKSLFMNKYLIPNSRLIYLISNRIDRICAALGKYRILNSVEYDIKKRGLENQEFRNSVIVTSEIINKIKILCSNCILVAFCVDDEEPYYSQFKIIFEQLGISLFEEIPELLKKAEKEGTETTLRDHSHWNEAGHEIVGKYLSKKIKSVLDTRQQVSNKEDGSVKNSI
jgi:hypothetical protein